MIVRVHGVKKVQAKGRIYYYHRTTGTRLPDPVSPDFLTKVRELDTRQPPSPTGGTLGHLIAQYRSSNEFIRLAPRTQVNYQQVLNDLKALDGMPLIQIDRAFVYNLRDRTVADRKRGFTNRMLQVLQLMWNWGARRGLCEGSNPVSTVERVSRPRNAPVVNRPWREEELTTVLSAASPPLRVAVALGAYAGLREGDVVKATWACYDGRSIETRQNKTGLPVWVPAHYTLRKILDETTRASPVIVIGEKGKPYSSATLRSLFFRLIARLKDEGQIGAGLSFHGLRHTLATRLAEAGCDAQTIASILGQRTTAMAEHYSQTANRRGNAVSAIEKLERKDRGKLMDNSTVTR